MRGGFSRPRFCWGFPPSLSTRRGRRFRASTTGSGRTCRPSILPSCSAIRNTPGSAPGPFRFTCYYYRGLYYRAFWADPPACTVGEPRKRYLGERSFPLIVQNVHRYFLYLALIFLVILSYDVWEALWFRHPAT